ncbi:MAG: discoidin domain-containing protein, partial [Gammaproteobacteria bacterium]
ISVETSSTDLVVGGYTGPGASVINDANFVDPEDSSNVVWYVSVTGGIANAYIGTADLTADPYLDSGFDLSGPGGQLVFDIKVNSISPGAVLTVKIDSGYPALGQAALSPAQYAVGSWRRVVIDFATLLADPGPGPGLDLNDVVNAFVIEVTGGSADFYLDDIFITHACAVVDGCNATVNTKVVAGGPDADNDGVEDSLDLCPGTPPGTPVDASGCSIILPPLSATATASTTGAAGGASLAVDGDPATRWESAHGIDPSWIALDLGSDFELYQVTIDWEAANAATYQIQGSSDNSNWTTLASESGGAFGDRTDIVDIAGTYRYVRMFGLTRTSVYGYSIWEIKVYGTPAADEDGDGVDDTRDLCPGTPAGSTVDADGCVIVDTDNDGVADSLDLCPGTPPATPVDASGCAIIIPVNEVASINGILAGGSGASQPGFTLYVFDNDLAAPGTSTCNAGCATSWPPLLVTDGAATGVSDLGTVTRDDGALQATHAGRPLYFYVGDTAVGDTNGDGAGGVWHTVPFVQVFAPLFDGTTALEPALQEDTPTALITRLSDRARDRHAREDQFKIYDHYLSHYWEHRTAAIEIVDTIGKGGDTITFNVKTQWQLSPTEAELRFFYRGINTVAEYYNNGVMTAVPGLDVPGEDARHYTRSLNFNQKFNRPLQVGDRLEFELSQFLIGVPNGRNNYYGTTILYIVGQGVVPWEARGVFGDPATEREDSYPMPVAGWLGGNTTLPYQYSDEPDNHFMQMAGNLSNINGQVFVLGRRVHHTNFGDGSHDEPVNNPPFTELANKLGTNYINDSCVACHTRNGRALPPPVGQPLEQYVVKVGDASGSPHPQLGAVLQPEFTSGTSEGGINISSWSESNGLRSPNFSFTGVIPDQFSARIAPQ